MVVDGTPANLSILSLHTDRSRRLLTRLPTNLRTKRHVDVSHDHIRADFRVGHVLRSRLPVTFGCEVSAKPLDKLLDGHYPRNILIYHYLRGIDGMLPGTSGRRGRANRKRKKTNGREEAESLAREMTEGLTRRIIYAGWHANSSIETKSFAVKKKREIKAVGRNLAATFTTSCS